MKRLQDPKRQTLSLPSASLNSDQAGFAAALPERCKEASR